MRPAMLTGMLIALLGVAPTAAADTAISILVEPALRPCRPVAPGTPIVATVQDALDLARPGDDIGVCPGVYAGGVIVRTPGITMEGLGAAKIVGPSGFHGVDIRVDDVTIAGLDISGFGGCAIQASLADRVSLRRNHLHRSGNGICLGPSDDTVIRSNTIEGNASNGIEVMSSSGATITNNTVTRSGRDGILLVEVSDSAVDHNLVTDSVLRGITLGLTTRITVTNNTLRDDGGAVVFSSDGVVVDHNMLIRTDLGIIVSATTNCTVSSNAVTLTNTFLDPPISNATGIGAYGVDHCLITHNVVNRNRGNGILIAAPGPGNVVSFNGASDNFPPPLPITTVFDCTLLLEGGTMPTFVRNVCGTESPTGVWD